MRQVVTNYSFDTTAQTITLTDFTSVDPVALERLFLVTDVTRNEIVYSFADPTIASAVVSNNNVITFSSLPGGVSNSDHLQIIYEAKSTDPIYEYPVTELTGALPAGANALGTVEVTNFPATQPVSGTVDVNNFPATQAISGTVSVSDFPATTDVQDIYGTFDNFGGWQTTDGGVLTFNVAGGSAVDMLWVRIDDGSGGNAIATCDPSGGTPTATAGVPLDDGIDKPITLKTSTVKVYSSTSAKYVKVWGYRY